MRRQMRMEIRYVRMRDRLSSEKVSESLGRKRRKGREGKGREEREEERRGIEMFSIPVRSFFSNLDFFLSYKDRKSVV